MSVLDKYEMILGLEIHAQLNTKTKLWCSCALEVGALENTRVCEVCSGAPGTLPVLNKEAATMALMAGVALNCDIHQKSYFDRKNYFYPDLPKGYQITQYETPLGENGHIFIHDEEGNEKEISIERVQIEEDTGKSTHEGNYSLIDLNRAGTPLIEIVSRPDMRSAKEASNYYKKIHAILTYLGVCKGNMQEGNLRCDVNLSLRKRGEKAFGTRTEMKNINSFRNVEKAIGVEMNRQAEILDAGGEIKQVTLTFDANENQVKVMREKGAENDYRYFPEPDLPPLAFLDDDVQKAKENLPELPDEKRKRFVLEYELPLYDAEVLTSSKELAAYFEEAVKNYEGRAKLMSNWIMVELLKLLNEAGKSIDNCPVPASELATLMNSVHRGDISGKMAKEVFQKMYDEEKAALTIISDLGLKQISDEGELQNIVDKIIAQNASQVEAYRNGKDRLFGFFVGQVMKETKGQANPGKVNELLKKALAK